MPWPANAPLEALNIVNRLHLVLERELAREKKRPSVRYPLELGNNQTRHNGKNADKEESRQQYAQHALR